MRVRVAVTNRLPALTAGMRAQLPSVLNAFAADTRDVAKQLAPVKTGALRDSIEVIKRAGFNDLQSIIEVGVEYGIAVEVGTTHSTGQPYLLPAADSMRGEFERRMAGLFK